MVITIYWSLLREYILIHRLDDDFISQTAIFKPVFFKVTIENIASRSALDTDMVNNALASLQTSGYFPWVTDFGAKDFILGVSGSILWVNILCNIT